MSFYYLPPSYTFQIIFALSFNELLRRNKNLVVLAVYSYNFKRKVMSWDHSLVWRVTDQPELALVLSSLIRWRSRPASGHKSIDSVPVISLMKYLHRGSGCQFSKSCPEMYIGTPSQFRDTQKTRKSYTDILLVDMLTFSTTLDLEATLR